MDSDSKNSATGICQICGKTVKAHYLSRHLRITHRINSKGEELPDNKVKCSLCKKEFKSKKHLQVHLKRIHHSEDATITPPPTFQCQKCVYKTFYKHNLKRHVTKNHILRNKLSLECLHCPAKFFYRKDLKHHEQEQHNIGPKEIVRKPSVYNRKCPLCPFFSCKTKRHEIYNHFKDEHNISIKWESHCFENLELFYEWKSNLEKSNEIYFAKKSNKLSTVKGHFRPIYFQCHRSGTCKEREKPSVRPRRITIRINAFCPSEMKMTKDPNGRVVVKFLPCHVGHEGKVITSLHYINDQEMSPLDLETIEACIQDLKSNQNISKLYCKMVGKLSDDLPHLKEEDFLLILLTNTMLTTGENSVVCVDSTLGYNNCKFQLYTLLIMDENAEGVPVAFMFTNKNDEITLYTFFEKVRDHRGQMIPDLFMSPTEEVLYSEWVKVMGPPKFRSYCTWHVLSVWRKSLKNVDKKGEGYKALKSLLYEFDKDNFHRLLNTVGEKLKNDDQFKEYYKGFEELYVNYRHFELWAYCYRIHSGVYVNFSLENFNKILRICGLRGKGIDQVRDRLCTSLRFFRDKLFDMLIKLRESKMRSKLHSLKEGHKMSLKLSEKNVTSTDISTWQVSSVTGPDLNTVKRVQNCSKCHLNCNDCEACIHEYICSCKESLVRKNMCQHIHTVARINCHIPKIQKKEYDDREYELIINDTCDIEEEIVYGVCIEESTDNIETRKKSLIEKLKSVTDFVSENGISDEQMEYLENQMDEIMTTLNTMGSESYQ